MAPHRPLRDATQAFVVVSGLPASGKSTLARRLGEELDLPVIDKDTILESLFERTPVVSAEQRSALSREADDRMHRLAAPLRQAILVSWWRHPASTEASGTDLAWLRASPARLVEVHVVCPPDLAVARFLRRQRHPGHLDSRRDEQALRQSLVRQSGLGPLGLGRCIESGPDVERDFDSVCGRVVAALWPAGRDA